MLTTARELMRSCAFCPLVILAIGCGGEVSPRAADPATATATEETDMEMLVHTLGDGPPVVLVGGG